MKTLRQRDAEFVSHLRAVDFTKRVDRALAGPKKERGKLFATLRLTGNALWVQDLDFRTIAVRDHNFIIAEHTVIHSKERLQMNYNSKR